MKANRSFFRRCTWIAATLLLLFLTTWALLSVGVAYQLTRRPHAPFAEPAPLIAGVPCEAVRLSTSDGQEIGGWYRPGPDDGPAVLMLHGHGASRRHCLAQTDPYVEAGCTLLLISMRAHGDSTGDTHDVGYSARYDVLAAVDYLERRRPGKPIVIQGTSMGSAAAVFAAEELGTRVHGYILESPYRDLKTAVKNRTESHLPPVLDHLAYWGLLCAAPLFVDDLDAIAPINHIGKIPASVPVLILAGTKDTRARPEEAQGLFERVESHARLIWFDNAGHIMLYRHNPMLYREVTQGLLQKSTQPESPQGQAVRGD